MQEIRQLSPQNQKPQLNAIETATPLTQGPMDRSPTEPLGQKDPILAKNKEKEVSIVADDLNMTLPSQIHQTRLLKYQLQVQNRIALKNVKNEPTFEPSESFTNSATFKMNNIEQDEAWEKIDQVTKDLPQEQNKLANKSAANTRQRAYSLLLDRKKQISEQIT